MRELAFSAEAQRDLIEAWEYIAADNVSAADRLRDRIEQAAARLAEMPGIGHTRADVRSSRYRFWNVRPYVLAYRYTARTVTIVRVLHGARDFKRILRGER
jgi:toxin ParE1/3/4